MIKADFKINRHPSPGEVNTYGRLLAMVPPDIRHSLLHEGTKWDIERATKEVTKQLRGK